MYICAKHCLLRHRNCPILIHWGSPKRSKSRSNTDKQKQVPKSTRFGYPFASLSAPFWDPQICKKCPGRLHGSPWAHPMPPLAALERSLGGPSPRLGPHDGCRTTTLAHFGVRGLILGSVLGSLEPHFGTPLAHLSSSKHVFKNINARQSQGTSHLHVCVAPLPL